MQVFYTFVNSCKKQSFEMYQCIVRLFDDFRINGNSLFSYQTLAFIIGQEN
jgi:hypothetical protein